MVKANIFVAFVINFCFSFVIFSRSQWTKPFLLHCHFKMDDLDDLDLDALMGELEAVQEEVTGNRLAERSCIEIMMKLISKNQLDVLYTLGKI